MACDTIKVYSRQTALYGLAYSDLITQYSLVSYSTDYLGELYDLTSKCVLFPLLSRDLYHWPPTLIMPKYHSVMGIRPGMSVCIISR
jgi:hypothetical protein